MQKYGFVYIWRDCKRSRYYVGCHWGNVDDGYICSSKWMRDAHRTRSKDFKRRILSTHQTKLEMFNEEERILQLIKEDELGKRYYNLCRHNFHHWSHDPEKTRSIAERASEHMKSYLLTPEGRKRYDKPRKPLTEEQLDRKRQGHIRSWENRNPKASRKVVLQKGSTELHELLGKKSKEGWARKSEQEKKQVYLDRAETFKKNNNKNRLGHKSSPEHVKKIADANRGKKRSDETKHKLSESKRGRAWWVNIEGQTKLSRECPGPEWTRGR